jgi:hypothetical protein
VMGSEFIDENKFNVPLFFNKKDSIGESPFCPVTP